MEVEQLQRALRRDLTGKDPDAHATMAIGLLLSGGSIVVLTFLLWFGIGLFAMDYAEFDFGGAQLLVCIPLALLGAVPLGYYLRKQQEISDAGGFSQVDAANYEMASLARGDQEQALAEYGCLLSTATWIFGGYYSCLHHFFVPSRLNPDLLRVATGVTAALWDQAQSQSQIEQALSQPGIDKSLVREAITLLRERAIVRQNAAHEFELIATKKAALRS